MIGADFLSNLSLGLATALQLENLWYCFLGVALGTLVGVLPGIGALAALSMLFPVTFYLDPAHALIMLAGVYYGTDYGGSIASILLNLPGESSTAVTCLDGNPMARQGRAGVALFMTAIASFCGGSVGIIMMMVLSPLVVQVAFMFGPAEYFALMILGLVAATSMSSASTVKAIAMVAVGILIGLVGTDIYVGAERLTFGRLELADGVSIAALAMGLFGVSDIINSIGDESRSGGIKNVSLRSMIPTRDDLRRGWGAIARGSAIGAFFGALPGTGGTVASFASYALERKVSRQPERFGKGAIEGVVAPEAANNAAAQAAFIPTLTLGIPGSAAMALMLGILIVHGITPGPRMVTEHPDLFWGVVMSFWVGNLMLLVLNIPLIGVFISVLRVPYRLLFSAILVFVAFGVLSVKGQPFDIYLVVLFGLFGYVMRLFDFPQAPLLLGFVLGPLLEENFRRAMLLSRGSFATFVSTPIAGTLMLAATVLLLMGVVSHLRARRMAGG